MKVSVIIVNYNVRYFLEVCLHSVLRAAERVSAEIIVVDNNSKDDSCAMLRERFPAVRLIENKDNVGFSKANNQGVAVADGEYILFLNPDTVMPEDFLEKLVTYMDAHPDAGAIGPRLIDGKGVYAPDGKKSFPTLSVALFKTTGLGRLFPKSPYFNKYYAVHIGEWQTAEVEVLSGCCMMLRSTVLAQAGNGFDEDYFMYCEDVDLSWRVRQAGYKNIYYPEVTLIHYKGESTRKSTVSYVRIFNEALSTFVRKHYSSGYARLFAVFINLGIIARALFSIFKTIFRVLRLPLFDALVLLVVLKGMYQFWVANIKNIQPVASNYIWATWPAYLAIWVVTLYFNAAYDQPYRALRVVRGMLLGTLFILAYYGLLPAELRYSRGLIVLSGLVGTVALLGLHELLYRLGIFNLIPYDEVPRKAVIIAQPAVYLETAAILRRVSYAPALAGRIRPVPDEAYAMANIDELKPLLYAAEIQEVIFCTDALSYTQILDEMQSCGGAYDYKIHLPGSRSFVGSNSSTAPGELYTTDRRYRLAGFVAQRNKRVFDFVTAMLLLLLFPITFFLYQKPADFLQACLSVLTGRKTWIGYKHTEGAVQLPAIRPSVLPVYHLQEGYRPPPAVVQQLAQDYAQHYTPGLDWTLLLKNVRKTGTGSRKNFAD